MKLKNIFVLFMLLVTLSACNYVDISFIPFTNFIEPSQTKHTYQSVELLSDYPDPTSKKNEIENLSDLVASTNNGRTYKTVQTTGDINILVIPISFQDSNKTNLDDKKILIENAFFGDTSKNVNESLTSFYNKSSYGHLKIQGKVSDFFHTDIFANSLLSEYGSNLNASRMVLDLAINWYKETYDDIETFDNDKDGYIDCVYLIYDYKLGNSNSLFWGYTDRIDPFEKVNNIIINDEEPYASTYIWASYDFIKPASNNLVDSHVIIHEFGHALGLDDFYNNTDYQPLGFSDMMDCNLGDHNAYSKMAFNWTTPIVIKESATIELQLFQDTDQCILIPTSSGYNNSIFDEFLLLEFYSPTGINYKDTLLDYEYYDSNNNFNKVSLFSQYGIKLYHVDARAAYVRNKGLGNIITILGDSNSKNKMDEYKKQCEDNGEYFTYCLDFAFSNSNINHPFISLIEAGGKNTFKEGNKITNATLFQKGDSFGYNTYSDFKFYNGDDLTYKFSIVDMTSKVATIKFEKN